MDLGLQPDLNLGDIYTTQDRKYVFALAGTKVDPTTPLPLQEPYEGELLQINLLDKMRDVIWRNPSLGRISPPSPNGTKVALSLVGDPTHPSAGTFCLFIVRTKNCIPIDGTIDINPSGFFWIDDNTFATIVSDEVDEVDVYSINQDSIAKRSLALGNRHTTAIAPLPNMSGFIAAGYTEPIFINVNLTTSEIRALNYGVVSNYFAAIRQIGVSPAGKYLWYTRANHLDIVELDNGKSVIQMDNVSQILWDTDDTNLLLTVYPSTDDSGKLRKDCDNRE